MFKEIPTGIEIINNTELENQILIEIPNTKYFLHGFKGPNTEWIVGIVNRTSCYKRIIEKKITNKEFKKLVELTITNEKQYKTQPTILQLTTEYKSLIKEFRSKKSKSNNKQNYELQQLSGHI